MRGSIDEQARRRLVVRSHGGWPFKGHARNVGRRCRSLDELAVPRDGRCGLLRCRSRGHVGLHLRVDADVLRRR